ncbi:cytochrome b [Paraburkholderia silvatlantica]|uniref:Cytochrome b561 n=1 Tax=Paraburkholderia silvatlantica TaxID=321895 RepID=A0A2U1AGG7_9BURK|nr:cytochrome b [Paraburkholderia silvatlantica]MBB2928885.1 cytochrome b561 [Paraburkholderia silvatlantica]PVY35467.1 cytochrome b561 [Paraburkholderia silvatlantica]PXW41109.1 cytochrome b561 [Paraburkholderia silvatlantica]PYE27575.1 cytochrome b561 [Paraburkholderia silvatlantica]TDQ98064.1 cytochrome b561 [Paraburkholderia silvatlantica]
MATYTAATERYTKPAIFFHWVIFLLVALAWLAIEVRGPKGTDSRVFWSNVHFWAGSLVLVLAVLRLAWRLWRGAPAEIDSNALLSFLSRLVHLALYLFIFVQPLLGILMINAGGHPVTLAGFDLQIALMGPDPAARKFLKDAHELIGNLFYWVVGLHALAAIAHHVVFRDNTLRRMI